MTDEQKKKQSAVDVEARRDKDDLILATVTAELHSFEFSTGMTVEVSIADSVAGGNCESGVVAWRAKNAGGRTSVPAREMLEIAGKSRDQISRVVLGIRRAIARMKTGK